MLVSNAGEGIVKRATRGGETGSAACSATNQTAVPTIAEDTTASIAAAIPLLRRLIPPAKVTGSAVVPFAMASTSSRRASPMSRSLSRESFSRQRRRSRRIARGVDSAAKSGSRSMILAMMSEARSPANSACPLSISYSTQPNAQISVRLSTGRPRACSGLM